jgi:aryl-alcohol dehydrogenase-like predicted oxidoreductase
MEIERDGRPLFDAFQATWNALEPSSGPTLAVAHAEGVGVIVKEALANGRLVRGEESGTLQPHADRLGTTTDALALAFALEEPWIDVVLSGASTADQLRSNVRAAGLVLDDEARAALRGLARPAAAYWSERAELPWN